MAREIRRNRTREDAEEEAPRSRRRPVATNRGGLGDDHEQQERPRGRRTADTPTRKTGRTGAGGWGAAEAVKKALPPSGDYAKDLKIPDNEEIIIKFVEEEPFDSYLQHWIPQKGKQSFTCSGDDCPVCEVGNRPSVRVCFNVISLEGDPELFRWAVGSQIAEMLKDFSEDRKTAPLNRDDVYYSVKKVKSDKNKVTTTITPVKARDLAADYEIDPLTEDEIEDAIDAAGGLFDYTTTEDTPRSVLNQQADGLMDRG